MNTQGGAQHRLVPIQLSHLWLTLVHPIKIYHLGANDCSGLLLPATDYFLNAQHPAYG